MVARVLWERGKVPGLNDAAQDWLWKKVGHPDDSSLRSRIHTSTNKRCRDRNALRAREMARRQVRPTNANLVSSLVDGADEVEITNF